MTRFAFVFCTLGFVYINLFIVISYISILHDMVVRRSPEPLGRRMNMYVFESESLQIHVYVLDIATPALHLFTQVIKTTIRKPIGMQTRKQRV